MKLSPEELDKKATEWVNQVAPTVFKYFEEDLKIPYCDETICLLIHDAFEAGYSACEKEKAE